MSETSSTELVTKSKNFLVRNAKPLAATTAVVAVAALVAYKVKYAGPVDLFVTEIPNVPVPA